MHNELFAAALGLADPWFVAGLDFEKSGARQRLTIRIDFRPKSRFAVEGGGPEHPVHDTRVKRYQHLDFFQHECELVVRVPRVRRPDGRVVLVPPSWAGRLHGFTLLFEAMILLLCREMPFAAVARLTGLSWHKVRAICTRYVDQAVEQADHSEVRSLAIDETSRARGHDYVSLFAHPSERRVLFVAEGRRADTVAQFAEDFTRHGGDPARIASVSIDMSRAFIEGVSEHFPDARITFDKFHVIAHASTAVDETRRIEQRSDPDLESLRWTLLKSRDTLSPEQKADLDQLVSRAAGKRTARAWLYREQLREILNRKQVHVVRRMLHQWCTNVNRSRVRPMKKVAAMIRRHLDGIAEWARSRATNGFLEAVNGLFQAAKRKARGYTRFETIRTVIFLIAGKLDFRNLNPHAPLPA